MTVGALDYVRYPGQFGEYVLTTSFTAFDPKRKFCVNTNRGAAGIIMGYLELFDFGESEVRSASEETVARMSAVSVSRKALNQSAAVARHSRCRGNIIVVASI